MKRLLSIMLAFALIFAMAACTPDEPEADTLVQGGQENQQAQQEETEQKTQEDADVQGDAEESEEPVSSEPGIIEITVSGGRLSKPVDMSSDIDIKGPGIFWDASKRVLTLENVNFTSDEEAIIKVPVGVDVTIELKGENTLTNTKGYSVITCSQWRSGGNVTIAGSGSLKVYGNIHLYGDYLTVDGCSFEAVNTAGGNGENTVELLGNGGFTAQGGAEVIIDGGLNCGSGSDKLLVDGASMTIYGGNSGGYAVQTSSDVSVINGGALKIEREGAKGIEMTRKLLVDETSSLYIKVTGPNALGIFNSYEADISLLGKEVYIYGGDKAILAEDLDSEPKLALAEAAAGKYFPVIVQSPFGAEYGFRATVMDNPDAAVEYESYDTSVFGGTGYTYNLTYGVKEISW